MKKYHIKTFGCAMNHSDSERIAAILEKNNFKATSDISEADLAVFNTCGVRQMAEDRVYGQIHNIRNNELRIMNHGTKKKIVLTGCLANRKDVQKRLKDKVDLFCEIRNFNKDIKSLLKESVVKNQESEENHNSLFTRLAGAAAKRVIHNSPTNKEQIDYLSINPKHTSKHTAYVPIMTGCNNFCAYCVVPHARGREVSRPAEEIIKEVKSLVKKGFKHIILLGQNVNSYRDSGKNSSAEASAKADSIVNFSQLLRKINAIPGKFWIGFVSNHPKDVTGEMIKTVAQCQKVCECFHLPIQSGNDEIIRRMNRKYTAKQYLNLIKKIKVAYKKYKPATPFAITSDIIVGFPGETRKQFLDSSVIMEKTKYDMVYFGQFSPRPGTAAWKMKDGVSKAEKVRREKYLNEILKKTALENNQKYVGKTLEVLVDKSIISNSRELETMEDRQIIYLGKTRTMKNVKISLLTPALSSGRRGGVNLVGKFVKVKINKAGAWNLTGEIKK